jgi:CMP-N-acetylneuraminic acid synthetase
MKKKIPCFILARKNSKSLKDKNKFLLNKIPLIQHTINFAKKSKYVTDIVISTDDKKIAEIGKNNKCIVIYPRPKKLSNDQATSIEALSHAVNFF